MNIRVNTIRSSLWSALQDWGGQVINVLVLAVLARFLSAHEFGLLAMALVFISFVQVFVKQGLGQALIQRQTVEADHLDTAFWTNLATGLILTLLAWLSSGLVSAAFDSPELKPVLQSLSFLLLMRGSVTVQDAVLQRAYRYKQIAQVNLLGSLAGGFIGVALAIMGYGVWSLVAQQLLTALVQVVGLWMVSNWRPRRQFSVARFKELFSFGLNVIGINITETVNRQADNLLIGAVLGITALGYYSLAYKIYQTLTQLLTGVTSRVAFTSFSKLQHNLNKMRSGFYSMTSITSVMSFPVFLGLIAIAPSAFPMLVGPDWEDSVSVLMVLCLVGMLESVYYYNANVMMAMGKPSWRLKLNLLAAVANFIAFVIAVRWGIVAVAAAYVIRAYLLSPISLYLVKRLIGISYAQYFRNLAPVFLAALLMVGFLYLVTGPLTLLDLSNPIELGVSVFAAALVYVLVLYLLSSQLVMEVLGVAKVLTTRGG